MIPVNQNTRIKNTAYVVSELCPSFSGIVAQECKGHLWVDDIAVPTLAIAESYAVGSFAFLGILQSKVAIARLKEYLETELFTQLKENNDTSFEFSIESDDLRDGILEMFHDKKIHTEKEFSFRTNTIPAIRKDIPSDYQIRKVDSDFWKLLSEGQLENADFLAERLLESWHSFEEFQNKSVAYCSLLGNRIVAVIVGTAHYKNVIPIDIETEESHRRKGLAYAMAAALIEDCLHKNYIPQWDCVESNQASYHMACKLGFEQIHENTVYWFDLD